MAITCALGKNNLSKDGEVNLPTEKPRIQLETEKPRQIEIFPNTGLVKDAPLVSKNDTKYYINSLLDN